MNFEYFGYYMITAFGQAATTFTGQNYAAGNYSRCKKILGISLWEAVLFSAVITVPITLWRPYFSGLFSNDSEVIAAACPPYDPGYLCASYCLDLHGICTFSDTGEPVYRLPSLLGRDDPACGRQSVRPASLPLLTENTDRKLKMYGCVLRPIYVTMISRNLFRLTEGGTVE